MHPGFPEPRSTGDADDCPHSPQDIEMIAMNSQSQFLQSALHHRDTRRTMLKRLGLGAAATASLGMLSPMKAFAGSGPGLDAAVLNFALNLEYLEGEYYVAAVTGAGLEAQGVGVNGSGTPGAVTIKANPKVTFATPAIEQYAKEIAQDEMNHVKFLRAALTAAGVQPAARPAIDLKNSFTAAARAAGIVGPAGEFDPFADELSFLLGAFIFEDVGVTAYKGGSRLITNKDYLEAAAGILGVEAYHAGIIRTTLFRIGGAAIDIAKKISDVRDAVDGASDLDQPLLDAQGNANLVPTDENSIVFSRTTRQVLNIVYLNPDENNHSGGFFPNGLNGAVR